MSAKPAVKLQSAPRSSAELAAAHDEQVDLHQRYESEYEQLQGELPTATLAGVEALAAHEDKMNLARRNALVASARADELSKQHDEALQRERNDALRARYQQAQEASAKLRPQIEAAYEKLKDAFETFCRQKALDDEKLAINRQIAELQSGLAPLPPTEAWRHEAAVPPMRAVGELSMEKGSAVVTLSNNKPRAGDEVSGAAAKTVTLSGGKSAFIP